MSRFWRGFVGCSDYHGSCMLLLSSKEGSRKDPDECTVRGKCIYNVYRSHIEPW